MGKISRDAVYSAAMLCHCDSVTGQRAPLRQEFNSMARAPVSPNPTSSPINSTPILKKSRKPLDKKAESERETRWSA
jgi:hypothetical protein